MKILFAAAILLTTLWLAIANQPSKIDSVRPYGGVIERSKLHGYLQ